MLHQGGPKNTKLSVAEIDKLKCHLAQSKIKDIQCFQRVLFHELGMVFQQYFDCGAGHFESYSDLKFKSGLKIISDFSQGRQQSSVLSSKKRQDRSLCCLFFCPQLDCVGTFQTNDALTEHIDQGNHHFHTTTNSSIDSVKKHYAKLLHEASHTITSQNQPSISLPMSELVRGCKLYGEINKPGWALPK